MPVFWITMAQTQTPFTRVRSELKMALKSRKKKCIGVQSVRRTGAHEPRGAHASPKTINRLHGSSQYNKQLLSVNCLFLLIVLLSIIFS